MLSRFAQVRTKVSTTRMYAAPEEVLDIAERVLYKDDKVLVINKPFGMAVAPGPNAKNDLTLHLHNLRFGNRLVPHIAHHLDSGTTGVLLLSRNLEGARQTKEWFKMRKVRRIFKFLVLGKPDLDSGVIDVPVSTSKTDPDHKGNSVYRTASKLGSAVGRKAVTKFKLIKHFPGPKGSFSLLQVEPVTHEKHQMRTHLCDVLRCPVVGDHLRAPHKAYMQSHMKGLKVKRDQLPLVPLFSHAAEVHLPPNEDLGFSEALVIKAPFSTLFESTLSWLQTDAWHSPSAEIIDYSKIVVNVSMPPKKKKESKES